MYHCDITEDKFLLAAEKLKSTGLLDAGYNYVNSEHARNLSQHVFECANAKDD